MAHLLDEYLSDIHKVFLNTENKYEAHFKCHPLLHRMAREEEIIFELFRRHLENPKFLDKKTCTLDFQLLVMEQPECFMFVNFFGPNEAHRTDYTYSTMHTHGDFLLSTINAKGPGYRSLIFDKGFEVDPTNGNAKLDLKKYVLHYPDNIEFMDAQTAHVLFYPEAMTMTYGLWSTYHPTTRMTKLKASPIVQKNKDFLKKALASLQVKPESLGIAQYREDFFYPENGVIKHSTVNYFPAPGKHFHQNLFNVMQEFVGFEDYTFLKNLHTKRKAYANDESLIWIEKAIEREPIARNYESFDQYVPKRNEPKAEFQRVYNF